MIPLLTALVIASLAGMMYFAYRSAAMARSNQKAVAEHQEHLDQVIQERTRALETANLELNDTLDLMEKILSAPFMGITAYTPDGQCIMANEAVGRIIGQPRENVLKQNFRRLDNWKAGGLLACALKTLETGHPTEKFLNIKALSGKELWLHCRFFQFIRKETAHLLMMVEDITEQKKARDQITKAMAELERSNRDLQDFAYIASHDLQEPLRKIVAFGDLLVEEEKQHFTPTGRDYLDRIQSSARRMSQLINDLLAYSRITIKTERIKKVNLESMIREIMADLSETISANAARIECGDLPTLEAEPVQMRQLFQNLIANSIKYRQKDHAPLIEIFSKTIENGLCEITVRDNGIGFDEAYSHKIFQPFKRLHGRSEYPGTGMGLAICHKIVTNHGGRITARGVSGKGASFIVTLPTVTYDKEDI